MCCRPSEATVAPLLAVGSPAARAGAIAGAAAPLASSIGPVRGAAWRSVILMVPAAISGLASKYSGSAATNLLSTLGTLTG